MVDLFISYVSQDIAKLEYSQGLELAMLLDSIQFYYGELCKLGYSSDAIDNILKTYRLQ